MNHNESAVRDPVPVAAPTSGFDGDATPRNEPQEEVDGRGPLNLSAGRLERR